MGKKLEYYSLKLIFLMLIIFILQLIFKPLTSILILNAKAFQEPWRFLTAALIHASLAHFLYNMLAMFAFALPLEGRIGSKHFLTFFILSAIIVNLIVVNYYPSSLGASGAIFAVIGFLAILSPFSLVIMPGFLPMPLILAAFVWAIFSFLGIFVPSQIGHLAHLIGLAFGIFYGLAFRTIHSFRFSKNL